MLMSRPSSRRTHLLRPPSSSSPLTATAVRLCRQHDHHRSEADLSAQRLPKRQLQFLRWYTEKSGGTKITTDTVFHANATVYAHWTYTGGGGGGYNPPVTYYTLRFETGGGSDIPSVQNIQYLH